MSVVLPSQPSTSSRTAELPREGVKHLILDVTGTPNNAETIQVNVEVRDEISGKWAPIYSSTALAGTAFGGTPTPTDRTTLFHFGYGGNTSQLWANGIGPVGIIAPPLSSGVAYRVRVAQSGGSSWTYSLSAVA